MKTRVSSFVAGLVGFSEEERGSVVQSVDDIPETAGSLASGLPAQPVQKSHAKPYESTLDLDTIVAAIASAPDHFLIERELIIGNPITVATACNRAVWDLSTPAARSGSDQHMC